MSSKPQKLELIFRKQRESLIPLIVSVLIYLYIPGSRRLCCPALGI